MVIVPTHMSRHVQQQQQQQEKEEDPRRWSTTCKPVELDGKEEAGRQAGRHSPSVGSRDGRSDAARTGGSPPFKETFPLLVSRLR